MSVSRTLIEGFLILFIGLSVINAHRVLGESLNQSDLQIMESLYQTAAEAFRKGNLEESEKNILSLLKINPKQPSGLYLYGLILMQKKERRQALETFKEIIEVEPLFFLAYYQAGQIYEEQGEIEKAVNIYNTGLLVGNLYPDARPILQNINRRLLDIGETPEKALQSKEYFDTGQKAYNLGKLDEAYKAYLSLNSLLPHSRGALLFLGLIANRQGKTFEAFKYFKKVIDEDSGFYPAHLFLGTIYEGRGELQEAFGEYIAAASSGQNTPEGLEAQKRLVKVKAALALESDRFDSPGYKEAKMLLSKGINDFQAEKYEEANDSFQKAAELDDKNSYAFYNLGLAQVKLNKFDLAADSFKKALLLKADHALTHFWLALMFEISGNTAQRAGGVKEALEEYREAMARFKETIHYGGEEWEVEESFRKMQNMAPLIEQMEEGAGYFIVGNELFSTGRFEPSLKLLKKASELFPYNPLPHHNIGFIYEKLGDDEKAESAYKKSLELSSEIGDSHYRLGLLYEKKQEFGKAEQAYEKASQINPLEADYHFRLALALDHKGDLLKAIEAYRAAATYARDKNGQKEIYEATQIRIPQILESLKPLSTSLSHEFFNYDSNVNSSSTHPQSDISNQLNGNLSYILLRNSKWTIPLSTSGSLAAYSRSQEIFLTLNQGISVNTRFLEKYSVNTGLRLTYSHTGTGPSFLSHSVSLSSSKSGFFPSSVSAAYSYERSHSYISQRLEAERQNLTLASSQIIGERDVISVSYTYFINRIVDDQFAFKSHSIGMNYVKSVTNLLSCSLGGSYAIRRYQQFTHQAFGGEIVDDFQTHSLIMVETEVAYRFEPMWSLSTHLQIFKNMTNFDIPTTSSSTSLLTAQTSALGAFEKYSISFKISRDF